MLQPVTLPLEIRFDKEGSPDEKNTGTRLGALDCSRTAIGKALHQIVNDLQTRRVLDVETQKVEYVEAHNTIRLRHLAIRNSFLGQSPAAPECGSPE